MLPLSLFRFFVFYRIFPLPFFHRRTLCPYHLYSFCPALLYSSYLWRVLQDISHVQDRRDAFVSSFANCHKEYYLQNFRSCKVLNLYPIASLFCSQTRNNRFPIDCFRGLSLYFRLTFLTENTLHTGHHLSHNVPCRCFYFLSALNIPDKPALWHAVHYFYSVFFLMCCRNLFCLCHHSFICSFHITDHYTNRMPVNQ